MKTSQWIGALAVLVVMVFGITFALNFLTTEKPSTTEPDGGAKDPSSGHNLTILEPVQWTYHEERLPGSRDFAFTNPWDEDVHIGLLNVSCEKCVSVEVVLATPAWKAKRDALQARPAPATLGGWFSPAPLPRPITTDPKLLALQSDLKASATLEPLNKTREAVVPARATGWLRLRWAADPSDSSRFMGLNRINAELWVGSPRTGMNLQIQAEVYFVPALQTESLRFVQLTKDGPLVKQHFVPALMTEQPELPLSDLNETDLVKNTFETSFRVWSCTRSSLQVRTEVVRLPRFASGQFDPLEVGAPVPLSDAERATFLKEVPNAGPVLCAYRIPVKLKGRSDDGKDAVDLGGFRRRLRVWSDADAGVEPMEVMVTGYVQGNVQIGDSKDAGLVFVGTFDSSAGSAARAIVLTGKAPSVQLEVDKERTPEFLRDGTRLEEMGKVAGLPRWKLLVQVKPNAAHGDFPRGDDPQYRDSAVYLKLKGEVAQSVRIAVKGTANGNE